jgi:hypothetical protein
MIRGLLALLLLFPVFAQAAFPTVRSSSSEVMRASNNTTHLLTMPATIVSGDALICLAGLGDAGTTGAAWDQSTLGTWTQLDDSIDVDSNYNWMLYAKVADGTEDALDLTLTSSNGVQSVGLCYAIQDWGGSITDIEVSTSATGSTSTAPDPSSLTPTWGSGDTLWIAMYIDGHGDNEATAYPTSYTANQLTQDSNGSGSNTVAIGAATRENATATEDPAAFTTANSSNWEAFTVGVKAAGSTTTWTDDTVDVGTTIQGTLDVAFSGAITKCVFASGDELTASNADTDSADCAQTKADFLSGGSLSNTRIASATTASMDNASETSTADTFTFNSPDNGTTEHFGTAGNASPDPDSLYSDSDFTTEYSSFDSNADDVWVTVSTVEGIFECTVVPATGVVRVYDVSATDWLTESSWTVTSPQGDCQTDVVLSPLVRPIVYSPVTQIFCN